MEKILKIEEIENVKYDSGYIDGYAITTDKQVIRMGISNHSDCCEVWGYLISEDNLDNFIGANLIGLSITDTALNTIVFEKDLGPDDMEAGGMMFVNVNTDRGLLQFVAYNAHNGYYGHPAYVISEQLNHQEWL